MRKRSLIIAGMMCAVALAGCESQEDRSKREAKEALDKAIKEHDAEQKKAKDAVIARVQVAFSEVKKQLNDPGSAQFKSVENHSNGSVCGKVNAKNKFGGYTDFQQFAVSGVNVVIVPPDNLQNPPTVESLQARDDSLQASKSYYALCPPDPHMDIVEVDGQTIKDVLLGNQDADVLFMERLRKAGQPSSSKGG